MDNFTVSVIDELLIISAKEWNSRSDLRDFAKIAEKGKLKLEVRESEDRRSVSLHFKVLSK